MQSIEQFEMFIASADGASRESVASALDLARRRRDQSLEDGERYGEWQHIVVQLEALLEEVDE